GDGRSVAFRWDRSVDLAIFALAVERGSDYPKTSACRAGRVWSEGPGSLSASKELAVSSAAQPCMTPGRCRASEFMEDGKGAPNDQGYGRTVVIGDHCARLAGISSAGRADDAGKR